MKKFVKKVLTVSGGNLELEQIPDDLDDDYDSYESEGESEYEDEGEGNNDEGEENGVHNRKYEPNIRQNDTFHAPQDSVDALFDGPGADVIPGFNSPVKKEEEVVGKKKKIFGRQVLPMVTVSQLQNRRIGNIFKEEPIEEPEEEQMQEEVNETSNRNVQQVLPQMNKQEHTRNRSRNQWEQNRNNQALMKKNPSQEEVQKKSPGNQQMRVQEQQQLPTYSSAQRYDYNQRNRGFVQRKRPPPRMKKKKKPKKRLVIPPKPRKRPPPPPTSQKRITRLMYHRESVDDFTNGELLIHRITPVVKKGTFQGRPSNIVVEENVTVVPVVKQEEIDYEEEYEDYTEEIDETGNNGTKESEEEGVVESGEDSYFYNEEEGEYFEEDGEYYGEGESEYYDYE